VSRIVKLKKAVFLMQSAGINIRTAAIEAVKHWYGQQCLMSPAIKPRILHQLIQLFGDIQHLFD
jgi:hypothetical protein